MIRLILLSAIFLAGCAISPNVYKNTMSGQFTRMPRTPPIDANVGLEVRHSLAPAMRAFWKAWLNGDQHIANYEQAVTELLLDDIAKAQVFRGMHLGGATTSDLLIRIDTIEDKDRDKYWVRVALAVLHPKTRAALATYAREQVTSTSMTGHKPLHVIPGLLSQISGQMRADVPRLVAVVQQGETSELAKACEQRDDVPRRIRGCTDLIARADGRPGLQAYAYTERAAAHLQSRDLDRAAADVDAALRLEPGHVWAHYFRGRIAETRRQYERAARDYERAASLIEASVAVKPDQRLRDSGVSIQARAREMEAKASMEQRWVEYLKSIQASNDHDNWAGPPYDLYRQTGR